MKREIKFSLVFRDMWQSAWKVCPDRRPTNQSRSGNYRDGLFRPGGNEWRRI